MRKRKIVSEFWFHFKIDFSHESIIIQDFERDSFKLIFVHLIKQHEKQLNSSNDTVYPKDEGKIDQWTHKTRRIISSSALSCTPVCITVRAFLPWRLRLLQGVTTHRDSAKLSYTFSLRASYMRMVDHPPG